MKKIKTFSKVVFLACVMIVLLPGVKAKATSYVLNPSASKKIGKYYVKRTNSKIYVRTSTKKSWKSITTAPKGGKIQSYTTNGSKIYYGVDKGSYPNESTTIFSILTSGKGKKTIKKTRGFSDVEYAYGDKIFYNLHPQGDAGADLYSYSIKTKKVKRLLTDKYITDVKNQYLLTQVYQGDFAPTKITCINTNNNKCKTIKNVSESGYKIIGNRIYYTKFLKYNWNTEKYYQKYQVYSCKFDGSNVKKHTNSFSGDTIKNVTNQYVTYWKDGNVKKYTYIK